MLENKKIRNPFPKIGLVFKYEFMSGIKSVMPVYLAVVILSLITGIFLFEGIARLTNDIFKIIIMLITSGTGFAAFIITLIFIEKRFKKSMLEKEAYFNLSLPVTISEHIIGRMLAYFVWSVIYVVVSFISMLLIGISQWGDLFNADFWSRLVQEFNLNNLGQFFGILGTGLIYMSSLILLVVMFIFFVNTISHIVNKGRLLLELVVVIVLFIVFFNILHLCFGNVQFVDSLSAVLGIFWKLILINAIATLLGGIGTGLFLKFRMNLEA